MPAHTPAHTPPVQTVRTFPVAGVVVAHFITNALAQNLAGWLGPIPLCSLLGREQQSGMGGAERLALGLAQLQRVSLPSAHCSGFSLHD